jgi:hypothetical protein
MDYKEPTTTEGIPGGDTAIAKLEEDRILDSLSAAVRGYQATASYCCGGSLPIAQPQHVDSTKSTVAKAQRTIALRWDLLENNGSARKIEFPLTEAQDHSKAQAFFDELIKSWAPATFGRNNEDILDESYRKAGKLDRSQFFR